VILYNIVITFFLIAILLNLLSNLKILKQLRKRRKALPDPPLVSILVPARNEEENIERCVRSLVNQDYAHYEIIVLDDKSDDDTPLLLQQLKREFPEINVVSGDDLPDGWTGKNFACHTLSKCAKGEWLAFTDADTVHKKDSISCALHSALRVRAKLISVLPKIVMKTGPEKLFTPLIYFALMSFVPLGFINTKKYEKVVIALGPFMLINAAFYRMIGGHEAIKDEILDDFRLAQQVKVYGGKYALLDGRDKITVRFYKDLRSVWVGFSKNSFGAFENQPLILLPFLAFCVCLYIIPHVTFVRGLLQHELRLYPFFQVLLVTLHTFLIAVRFKFNRFLIVFHPLSVFLWALIVLNSMRLTLTNKSLAWKERRYSLRKAPD
jgi:chlorobactene glucosyltransferase